MHPNKITKRIGKLILYVTRRKKLHSGDYSKTRLQVSPERRKEIYKILGALLEEDTKVTNTSSGRSIIKANPKKRLR
jgi:hypothetical protein